MEVIRESIMSPSVLVVTKFVSETTYVKDPVSTRKFYEEAGRAELGRKLIESILESGSENITVDCIETWDNCPEYDNLRRYELVCTIREENKFDEIKYQEITDLLTDALYIDGTHHKQWHLEQLADILEIDIAKGYEEGIAP